MVGNGSIYYKQGLDNSQLKKDAQETTHIFDKIGKDGEQAGGKIDNAFKNAGKAMAAFFTIQQAQAFTSQLIKVRGEFQQLEIAFNTMLGSAEAGQAMMAQAVETAAKTPFDLTQVAQGYKQLLAYGVGVDEVNESLTMLGDVASAVSAPLGDIVYLYGTLNASGRVTLMDIRQFAGRGIPIYEELAKVLGTTKDKVNEFASDGKIAFEDVRKAFQNLTGEGGRFYNLMEQQSKSLTGRMSNLKDNIDMMFNEIGKSSEGALNKGIELTSVLVDNYEKVGKTIATLVAIYGTYRTAVMVMNAVHQAGVAIKLLNIGATTALTSKEIIATTWTNLRTIAQEKLNAVMLANPYMLAAAGITVLIGTMVLAITRTTELEQAQNRLNKSFAEFDTQANSEISALNRLKGELEGTKQGTDEFKKAKDSIIDQFGKYYSDLGDEIDRTGSLTTSYTMLAASIRNAAMARGYDTFMKNEQAETDKYVAGKYEKIQKSLINKLGEEAGSQTFAEIRNSLVAGEELSQSLVGILDKVQKKGTILASSRIDDWINDVKTAYKDAEQIDKEAKNRFGVVGGALQIFDPRKTVETPKSKSTPTSIGGSGTNKIVKDETEAFKKLSDLEKNITFTIGNISDEAVKAYIKKEEIEALKARQAEILQGLTDFNDEIVIAETLYNSQIKGVNELEEVGLLTTTIAENKRLIAKQQYSDKLNEINAKAITQSEDWINLFENTANLTDTEIGKLIDDIKEKINSGEFELNAIDAQNMISSLEKARDGMRSPINQMISGIKSYMQALKDKADAERKLANWKAIGASDADIADATANVQKYAKDAQVAAGGVADAFGIANQMIGSIGGSVISVADSFGGDTRQLENVTKLLGGVATTGQGIAKMAAGDWIGGITDTVKGIADIIVSINGISDTERQKEIEKMQEKVEGLQDAYDNLGDKIEKAYSKDASKMIEQQNVMLKQQQILIKQQIAQEKAKKKTDDAKIKEWEQQVKDMDKLIEENKEKAVDVIFGEDVQTALERFTDAYISAWEAGENKAKSSKDFVKDMIKQMIATAMNSDMTGFMERLRTQMLTFLNDDYISDYEQNILDQMAEEQTAIINKKYGWADKYYGKDKGQGGATYGAYQNITESQANSIDGRLTGILMETVKQSTSLSQMSVHLLEMRDAAISGWGELISIRKNTALIADTNTKLDKLILNTSTL